MKKFMTIVAAALLFVGAGSAKAQNDFKGIVKYSVTSTGEMSVEIPAEMSTFELKVMGNKVYADEKASSLFSGGMTKSMTLDGLALTTASDYSQLLAYIAQSGEELATYKGDGKMIYTHTYTQQDVDSLTIPCTVGFYIEYLAGETKTIAGCTAKKARIHSFDDEGEDHPSDVWYDDSMGPQANFLFSGVKGMPLEVTMRLGENKAITFTAVEVKKGKVKDVDFLMPEGYRVTSDSEMQTFVSELQEVMKYMRDSE